MLANRFPKVGLSSYQEVEDVLLKRQVGASSVLVNLKEVSNTSEFFSLELSNFFSAWFLTHPSIAGSVNDSRVFARLSI